GQSVVAIKCLDRAFGQGDPEFWKEIIMLSQYRHDNIVSLLGFCDDCGEKILVCDYASKRSLDFYLNDEDLTWVQRLEICIGAARGLAYLHNPGKTQRRVLHRDIQSSNILLDENWNARIVDLGLSKFGPANPEYTFLVSNGVGIMGYCDPLYAETGLLTKESDVYSFGEIPFNLDLTDIKQQRVSRESLDGGITESMNQPGIKEDIHYKNSKLEGGNNRKYDQPGLKEDHNNEGSRFVNLVRWWDLRRNGGAGPVSHLDSRWLLLMLHECHLESISNDGSRFGNLVRWWDFRRTSGSGPVSQWILLMLHECHLKSISNDGSRFGNLVRWWDLRRNGGAGPVSQLKKMVKAVARFLDRVNRALGTGLIGKGLGMFYSRRRRRRVLEKQHGVNIMALAVQIGMALDVAGEEVVDPGGVEMVVNVSNGLPWFGNLVRWWDLRRNGGARPVSQSP
nr:protein kinase, ATP binding site-containing protein [Tanacetum cinerariifolium]